MSRISPFQLGPSFAPMAPISAEILPQGEEWLHQLKWDGIRLLAEASDSGAVELYTRKMEKRTSAFESIQRALFACPALQGSQYVLDGEAVVMDPVLNRPSFPLILKRQRTTRALTERAPVLYVIFDILQWRGQDLRQLPYEARHQLLLDIFQDRTAELLVTDAFQDGEALWTWVEANEWEGVVSKRRQSCYLEDKQHRDWYKIKKSLQLRALAAGYIVRDGRIASLMLLQQDGIYIGRVSIGMKEQHRELLSSWAAKGGTNEQPPQALLLPSELNKENIVWFKQPIPVEVSALEWTAAGVLRHPKLVALPVGSNA